MEAIELLKERRSVRKYKNEKVDRELMTEIIDLAKWAPSWANTQTARYTLVDDEDVIGQLAEKGVKGFIYNVKTLQRAKGVAVLSYVTGKSGKLDGKVELTEEEAAKAFHWELFDAGIACQTFCLAAHAKGVGTCVFGVINNEAIAEVIDLPENEKVGALIVYGYEDGEHAKATPRKDTEKLMRFI